MKKQKLELNRKLTLKKKSIAALNSSQLGEIQGGLWYLTRDNCAPSGLRCYKSNGGGDTCQP